MSQFEKDLNFAIQQSLEEEKKSQEASSSNQNQSPQNSNPTPQAKDSKETPVNNEVKMDVEDDEEAELEKARLMSIEEHDGSVKKKEEEESKKYFFIKFTNFFNFYYREN